MASDDEKSVQGKNNGNNHTVLTDTSQKKDSTYKTYAIRFYGLTLICILNIVSSINWLSVAPVPDYANAFFNNLCLLSPQYQNRAPGRLWSSNHWCLASLLLVVCQ
ncbi:hypothetical protein BC941DRAFT_236318 [Chlamydoabsidia padenii]|nr:hypothetical protein BC941DRAFT_236318 [Chlamydoabsidia padenii]